MLQWKPGTIMKTSGPIVKVGEYQGRNFDENGRPKKSKFDADRIERLYKAATEPVPMYIDDHNDGMFRTPIGYAFRFGMSGDQIVHNGYVFDGSAGHAIGIGGYGDISPEIETVLDEKGNVVSEKITGLCFVPESGISNNHVNTMREVFSSINTGNNQQTVTPPADSGNDSIDINAIVNAAVTQAVNGIVTQLPTMINDVVKKQGSQTTEVSPQPPVSAPPAAQNVQTPVTSQIDQAGMQKLDDLTKKYQTMIDSAAQEKVNEMTAELKKLGIANPEAIVTGLPLDAQMTTLKALRDNVYQTSSFMKTPDSLGGSGDGWTGASFDNQVNSVLKELGFTDPKYIGMLEKTIY